MSEHASRHHHDPDYNHSAHDGEPRIGSFGLLLDAVAHILGWYQHDHNRAFDSVLQSSARASGRSRSR